MPERIRGAPGRGWGATTRGSVPTRRRVSGPGLLGAVLVALLTFPFRLLWGILKAVAKAGVVVRIIFVLAMVGAAGWACVHYGFVDLPEVPDGGIFVR